MTILFRDLNFGQGNASMWVDANQNVQVGGTFAAVPFRLTVTDDIDLECSLATPQVSGYRINGNIVLATQGVGQTNTHVGVGAGSVSTGSDKTFV